MNQLLEDIVKAIVDKPDDVKVTLVEGDSTEIYELAVGDGDLGIVERCIDVSHTRRNIFPFAAADLCCLRLGHRSYCFLPVIGFAGPLRVRALVWVRWPRTGNPRR